MIEARKPGRKKTYEEVHIATVRVEKAEWDAIPKPAGHWIRQAMREKADRDGIKLE
jgi:hypothetical protein